MVAVPPRRTGRCWPSTARLCACARTGRGGRAKLVAVFDQTHGLVLAQAEVAGGDELAAFIPALDTVSDLRNAVVTADALHCQRAHATYLHARGRTTCSPSKATSPCCVER